MYKIKRVQKRSNVDIPWSFEKYPTSDEFLQHFKKNYIDTKKLVYNDRGKISEDRLVIVSIQHWNTRKDFLEFLTDDVLFEERIKKTNYDVDNDIISEFIVETENN